jgi:hypothetical protein
MNHVPEIADICLTERDIRNCQNSRHGVLRGSFLAPQINTKPEQDRAQDDLVSKRTPRQAPVYLPIPDTGSVRLLANQCPHICHKWSSPAFAPRYKEPGVR